jgi:hypothetical protein
MLGNGHVRVRREAAQKRTQHRWAPRRAAHPARDAKHGAALRHLPSGYPQVNTAWKWGALLAASIAGWLHQLTAPPDPAGGCSATVSVAAKP